VSRHGTGDDETRQKEKKYASRRRGENVNYFLATTQAKIGGGKGGGVVDKNRSAQWGRALHPMGTNAQLQRQSREQGVRVMGPRGTNITRNRTIYILDSEKRGESSFFCTGSLFACGDSKHLGKGEG